MPYLFLIAGLVFVTAGVRKKESELFTLVQGDFVGKNNFTYWVLAMLVLGSIGYIKPLKPISDSFMVLVILVLVLAEGNPNDPAKKGGFFKQFMSAINSTATATAANAANTTATAPPVASSPITVTASNPIFTGKGGASTITLTPQ